MSATKSMITPELLALAANEGVEERDSKRRLHQNTHCVCPGCGRVGKPRQFPRAACVCGFEFPNLRTFPTLSELWGDSGLANSVNLGRFLIGALKILERQS